LASMAGVRENCAASAALAGAWWADLWEDVHNPVLLMQPRTE
jgi:hypothetical protein